MPSKLLIATGRLAHDARRAPERGVRTGAVTGAVEVDGPTVMRFMRAERDRFVKSVLDEYHAIPADHRVHGEARFTGPASVAVADVEIDARAIVVTTGGHPVVPDGLDVPPALIHTHETIFELDDLPAAMAVLGAGPLGLELAQAFARLGVEVTVLDPGTIVGALKDPATSDVAKAALAREFDLHLGVEATASSDGDRARVCWTGGDEGEVVVDLILIAAGRPPTLEELELERTGIELDDHGVPVFAEETRRCGDSAIFVAGDAGGNWRPVLHEAARGGTIAGTVAAGGPPSRSIPPLAIAFTEPGLVEVGIGFDDLPRGARIGQAEMEDNGRSTVDGEDRGLVRLYADADGTLIGGSIVALGAEHLGHLVALGIDRGISVADFADQPWYHPTVEEALQQAARRLAGIDD